MFKSSCPVIAGLATAVLLSAVLPAQDVNLILANNEPYVQVATATHPTTGVAYNEPNNNPVEFSNGLGVPAGSWVWRVYPEETNIMREPRLVNGFGTVWRVSAATPTGATVAIYSPAIRLLGAKQRTGAPAGVLDPDFANTLLNVPSLSRSLTISSTNRILSWTVTLASPVSLNISGDHAIAAAFRGGEERDLAATATVPSQSVMGSVSDGPVYNDASPQSPYVPDGFAFIDPVTQAVTLNPKQFDDSRTHLTYGTANPSLQVFSDWGRRRAQAPAPPLLVGYSDGTYYSDLGTNASTGWGLEVWADSTQFAGGVAIAFMNIGPYFPASIPIPLGALGTPTIELNPTDPFFSVLIANVPMIISNTGIGMTPAIPQPQPLPPLVGAHLGFEVAVFNSTLTTLQTTQARWVKIVF